MPDAGKSRTGRFLSAVRKGGVRKGTSSTRKGTSSTRRVTGGKHQGVLDVGDEVIRLRTFPSETSRRLLATMSLAKDQPRSSIGKAGAGTVGLLDIDAVPIDTLLPNGFDTDTKTMDEVVDGGGKGKKKGKRKQKPRGPNGFDPSKGQMAKTFSKCLPKQDAEEFERLFRSYQGVTACPSGCDNRGISTDELILKTRVVSILWALQQLYGVENVVCEKCQHLDASRRERTGVAVPKRDYLEIVAMDAVLSRTLALPRRVTGTETVDTPVKFRAKDEESLDNKFDSQFRAFIAVVPDGATYYCHRERRSASVGIANELIPMDTSWLRLQKDGACDDRFGLGGYVSRLWDGQPFWKFKISRGASNFELKPVPEHSVMRLSWNETLPTLKVMSVYQCPDEDGPALPPDIIGGQRQDTATTRRSHLRRIFRRALMQSTAARKGCRHYAPTYLHGEIDPNETLIIDPKDGDIDFRVSVQIRRPPAKGRKSDKRKERRAALARESVVQVRYLPNLGTGAEVLVNDIRDHASRVTREKKPSARAGCGDEGYMYPVGMRVMLDKVRRRRYKTSGAAKEQGPLRKAVVAAARLAAVTIPGVLRIIQDAEEDGDLEGRDGGMNGDGKCCRISFSMDISVNLANASHYDINDATQGFSIWTEDEPGGTRNWYFVLPNVYGKWPQGTASGKNGPVFHGLAIKLTHGTLISWDGRVIRHCTSKMERSKNVYGTFFAAKSSIVAYGARMAFLRDFFTKRNRRRRRSEPKADCADVDGATVVGAVGDGDGRMETSATCAAIPMEFDITGSEHKEPMVADDDTGEDDRSWCDHDYASDVEDSGSVDSGMVPDLNEVSLEVEDTVTDQADCADGGNADDGDPPGDGDGGSSGDSGSGSDDADEHEDADGEDAHGEDAHRGDADRDDDHRGDGDDICHVEFSNTQQWAKPGSLDTCNMTPKDVGSVRWRGVGFSDARRSTNTQRHPVDADIAKLVSRSRSAPAPKSGQEQQCDDCSARNKSWVTITYASREGKGNTFTFNPINQHYIAPELLFAERVVVPCIHLQYHVEAYWDLLLPEFSTLRSGLDWSRGYRCYFVELVRCRTKFPIDRFDASKDTDDPILEVAVNDASSLVAVESDDLTQNRWIPMSVLNGAAFLGAKAVYFPDELTRTVFFRRFQNYLPYKESEMEWSTCKFPDGSMRYRLSYSRPDTNEDGSIGYYDQDGFDFRALVIGPLFKWRYNRVLASLEELAGLEAMRYAISSMKWNQAVDWEQVLHLVLRHECGEVGNTLEVSAHTVEFVLEVMCISIPVHYGVHDILSRIAVHLVEKYYEEGDITALARSGLFFILQRASEDNAALKQRLLDDTPDGPDGARWLMRWLLGKGLEKHRAGIPFNLFEEEQNELIRAEEELTAALRQQAQPEGIPQPQHPDAAPNEGVARLPIHGGGENIGDQRQQVHGVQGDNQHRRHNNQDHRAPGDSPSRKRLKSDNQTQAVESFVGRNVDDSLRLAEVQTPQMCQGKCNMMWNLHNSRWIHGFHATSDVTDSRYAHPDQLPASRLPDPVRVKTDWPVNGETPKKFSNCDRGCVASLEDGKTVRHALGWAAVYKKRAGQKWQQPKYLYPWEVTPELLQESDKIVVPCEHLQLFFEVMMGKALSENQTVEVGFHRNPQTTDGKIEQYDVRKVTMRTRTQLPTWDDDERASLLPFWTMPIDVTHHEDGNFLPPVKVFKEDAGVHETRSYGTSLSQGFTPAQFLGCSYIEVPVNLPQSLDFVKILRSALLKRVPLRTDVCIQRTPEDGPRANDSSSQRFHILQQRQPEDCSESDSDD